MSARHDNYAKLRLPFLAANRYCEIRMPGLCESTAGQVHHMCPRGRAPWMIDDVRNFAAVCGPCHDRVTRHHDEWTMAWILPSFRFPAYELASRYQVDDGQVLVRLTGVPDESLALVTEAFAVAMGPGWVDLGQPASISFRNGNPLDTRLANIAAGAPPQ